MNLRPGALLRGLASLAIAALLGSCSTDYVFVSDPVFDILYPEDGGLSAHLSDIARERGVTIDKGPYLAIEEPLGTQVQEILASLDPERGAILTPIFFREASSLARSFPDLDFFLLAGSSEKELPENLWSLRFDRREAFREAGRVAGKYLQETQASVVLFSELVSDEDRQEIAAFESELPDDSISRRFVFSRPPERETIRQQVVSVGEGAHLWAIFLRGNTAFALDLVTSRGDPVIAEDLGPGGAYSDILLGSVERPYLEATALGLAALEASANNRAPITVPAVFLDASHREINK